MSFTPVYPSAGMSPVYSPASLSPSFFSTHLLTREQCSEVPLREFHSGLSICEHVSRLFPREPCSELSTHHGISTVHHHHDADHRHNPFRLFTPRLTSSLGVFLAALRAPHPSPRRAATVRFSTYLAPSHCASQRNPFVSHLTKISSHRSFSRQRRRHCTNN